MATRALRRKPASAKYDEAKEIAQHIIENQDTDVTMEQVAAWRNFDLFEWLETWGYTWYREDWQRSVGDDDN